MSTSKGGGASSIASMYYLTAHYPEAVLVYIDGSRFTSSTLYFRMCMQLFLDSRNIRIEVCKLDRQDGDNF
jgi:hypothetical protein